MSEEIDRNALAGVRVFAAKDDGFPSDVVAVISANDYERLKPLYESWGFDMSIENEIEVTDSKTGVVISLNGLRLD